jgi:hypothetical protein
MRGQMQQEGHWRTRHFSSCSVLAADRGGVEGGAPLPPPGAVERPRTGAKPITTQALLLEGLRAAAAPSRIAHPDCHPSPPLAQHWPPGTFLKKENTNLSLCAVFINSQRSQKQITGPESESPCRDSSQLRWSSVPANPLRVEDILSPTYQTA